MFLAALFVLFFSVILTLSPSVRLHTWQVEYRWSHWLGTVTWLAVYTLLHRQTVARLPERDPHLLPIAALLTGWGLLTIWRLDPVFGLRQTLWLIVCGMLLALALRFPEMLNRLRRYKYLLLFSGLALMILTFFFGSYPGGVGPHLWLGCCGVYLQPSEPLKLLLIIYLAAYLADRLPMVFDFGALLTPTLVMAGAAVFLLVSQRDLGTTTLIVVLYTLVVYAASGKRRILLFAGALLIAAGIAGYSLFDVIRLRVDAWLNPWADPSGRSYQIVQSLIAFASGALFGSGPGLGSPSMVPVAHSDFIASAIAEETGLVGTIALALLICLLAVRGILIALNASNSYRRYLAIGITIYFASQTILIISGNIRLLPLTGVTLPFVSYGGSSLATTFLALAILLLVSENGEQEPAPIHRQQPYLELGAVLIAGLFIAALWAGWWSFGVSSELQARADNPRRSINDRYVLRGTLFDRQNRPLALTQGERGSYTRSYTVPALGSIIGYTHPVYGLGGLEASLDPYLRGLNGNPASLITSSRLLYNQPPTGLSVRLGLDLDMQQQVDFQLEQHSGAAVLLNSETGEILAMASHPTFDANQLENDWSQLINDPNSPLLIRPTQGLYPLGTALGPFALARLLDETDLPVAPENSVLTTEEGTFDCVIPTDSGADWTELIQNSCPGGLAGISRYFTNVQINDLLRQMGVFSSPEIDLPSAEAQVPNSVNSPLEALTGQTNQTVTPLQMALAAAALSNEGLRPAPRLATAVQTPNQGWVILPSGQSTQALDPTGVVRAVDLLSAPDLPIWEVTASASSGSDTAYWYLAGTLNNWMGTPMALAVLIEDATAIETRQIGHNIMQTVLLPPE